MKAPEEHQQGVPRPGDVIKQPFLVFRWEPPKDAEGHPLVHQARNSRELEEQQTMFALPKSSEMSGLLLETVGQPGSFDKLNEILMIRDSLEPFTVNINYQDPSSGETPLMRAASCGQLDVIKLLHERSFEWVIDHPLQVDDKDFLGTTALMKACQGGHLIVVKYLMEILQADITAKDCDGWSALMFAASKGHWHIVEYLVRAWDADVLESTKLGDTPLILAANNGYLNVVRFLVEETEAGMLPPEKDEDEPVPEQKPKVRKKVGFQKKDEDDGDIAEVEEDGVNEEDEQKEIFSQPVDTPIIRGLEQQNVRGWTALLSACHYGQLYVIHYLVSKGADPEVTDHQGQTARTIPLSLLTHTRFGVPVSQAQVLGAIESGLADRLKRKPTSKRAALERAILRFKRAERYMTDAELACQIQQFETATFLYRYAFESLKNARILREEGQLKEAAEKAVKEMEDENSSILEKYGKQRENVVTLEAQRNFYLADRYIEDLQWKSAVDCLHVCVKYDPENKLYQEKLAMAKAMLNVRKPSTSSVSAADMNVVRKKETAPAPPPPPPRNWRSCFSFF